MRRFPPALTLLLLVTGCQTPSSRFDLIIRQGQVYDGLAAEPVTLDIAIRGDRIAAMGHLGAARAPREIAAHGLAVAPGFIDAQAQSGTTLLVDGVGESHLRQGVTSEILGDGSSPAFWTAASADSATLRRFGLTFDWTGADGYFERLMQRGVTMNVGSVFPLDQVNDPGALGQALRRGALGVSVTRGADPDSEPSLDVLRAIAQSVAAAGGVLAVHLGGSPDQLATGLDEIIGIGRRTEVPIVLYEPAVSNFDEAMVSTLLAKIQAARADGVAISTLASPVDAGDSARSTWFRTTGAAVGSQTAAVRSEGPLARQPAHPRAYGGVATVLAGYVRRGTVVSLGEAIRRMTSTAATMFRLDGRGVLRPGAVADIVIFDAAAVGAAATEAAPDRDATGIRHVIVNGVPVLDPNGLTGARPGRPLWGRGRLNELPGS
jgi:N-acyl-D-amino-acid deacylase